MTELHLLQEQWELNLLGNPLSVSIVQWRNPKNNILKESEKCSTVKGEQFCTDISSIKQTSMGK